MAEYQPEGGYPKSILINCEDKFLCTLCKKVMINPHQSSCGHSFCKLCIDQLIRDKIPCSLCKGKNKIIDKMISHPNYEIIRILEERYVHCFNCPYKCLYPELANHLTEYHGDIVCNTRITTLESQFKSLSGDVLDKMETISSNILVINNAISSLEPTCTDGAFIWRVTDIKKLSQEAISGKTPFIYSPSYYTHQGGYKIRGKLYLNGNDKDKGTYVSILCEIMKGNYDDITVWPFNKRVTFSVFKHDYFSTTFYKYTPNCKDNSFSKPITEFNTEFGNSGFLSIDNFYNLELGYIKNDTVLIQISVCYKTNFK